MVASTVRHSHLRHLGLVLLLWMSASCEPVPAPEPVPVVPVAPVVEPLQPGVGVIVRIGPLAEEERTREYAALATLMVELALADLPGVVPQVEGTVVAPGLADAALTAGEWWELELGVVLEGATVRLRGHLCPPEAPCTTASASATVDDPAPGVVALMEVVEGQLGRKPTPQAADDRVRKGTLDAYALRLAGRSAAVLYGLRPPPEKPGDKRADPVMRAVLVDPSLAESGWAAARVFRSRGEPEAVAGALQRPLIARPSSLALRAEEASALAAAGHTRAAALAWFDLAEDTRGEPRFRIAAAEAALRDGRAAEADRWLLRVPRIAADTPRVTALRAEIAAGGDADVLAERLQDWARAAPAEPEPVRRLVQLRIRQDRFDDALLLVPDLRARGAEAEADALAPALLAALGRWNDAAAVATDPELAAALRARAGG